MPEKNLADITYSTITPAHNYTFVEMVCAKCQKIQKKTELATPGVKRKNDMYYGSPTSSTPSGSGRDKSKTSATLGNTGIGKVSTYI